MERERSDQIVVSQAHGARRSKVRVCTTLHEMCGGLHGIGQCRSVQEGQSLRVLGIEIRIA